MEKICPRCNARFECRNDHIMDCQCINVSLDARQLEYIGSHYVDCLCLSCLQDVKDGFYTIGINPKYSNQKQFNHYLSINEKDSIFVGNHCYAGRMSQG